ncbi:L-selectin-like [Chiloscyllium plagiosum]|uniref:L-selectin-like n=1 Tax=Chiloscyllium plagiosum TaxID=36176 RepID=UPI001CB8183C|nr:L-selectin-like [Chiloscyllium plagiosum]
MQVLIPLQCIAKQQLATEEVHVKNWLVVLDAIVTTGSMETIVKMRNAKPQTATEGVHVFNCLMVLDASVTKASMETVVKMSPIYNYYTCLPKLNATWHPWGPSVNTGANVFTEKCKATSCSRRGTCVELVNGFRCFCQHGFYGRNCENDNSTICQASGSWTTYNTTCQALTCPLLKKPAHSSVNCSGPYGGKHYNTSCYFSCDDGYTLEGDQKTICGESGNWNSHDVQCSMNYLKPILISVGVLIATAPLMLSVICWWKRRKSEGQNNTSDDFPMQQKTVEYENQDIYIIPTPYLNNDTPQEEIYVNLSIDQKMHKDLH